MASKTKRKLALRRVRAISRRYAPPTVRAGLNWPIGGLSEGIKPGKVYISRDYGEWAYPVPLNPDLAH